VNETRLAVLVALSDDGAASTAAAALRRRGHAVVAAQRDEAVRGQPDAQVVVCDLATLEVLRERGHGARAIVVDLPETPTAWRQALRLGAADALCRPWRLAELVAAVEAGPRAPRPAPPRGVTLQRSLEAEVDAIERVLRELCAFLVGQGIAPAARARALTATAEVLENAARHAYAAAPAGRVELSATPRRHEIEIEVIDHGAGFDPLDATREGGLARAAALAEDLRVTSRPGQGTRVSLRFSATRVDLDDGEGLDLSEMDWLSPALARRVLAGVEHGRPGPFYSLSPALAVTVGRLLAGAAQRQRAERALWS